MTPVIVSSGDGPIVLGQPHGGIYVPPEIASRLNGNGRKLNDTDWHITDLYDGLLSSASIVRATFHRYVIDANRDPAGQSLYPGQNTTGLCPVSDFDGTAIWQDGAEPDASDIEERVATFHLPYHQALRAEIERVKSRHGLAIVFDCHSIRSRIPYLFEGTLPDINIGTDNGKTCDPVLETATCELAASSSYSNILNGRFRGGWTTRHYGQPHAGVHAIQMEIVQSAYLESEAAPWLYSSNKASQLRAFLKTILNSLNDIALEMKPHA